MRARQLWILLLIMALSGSAAAPAAARDEKPAAQGSAVKAVKTPPRVCMFVDEDGDGFNDLAPDDDGDGIPNRLDPDYRAGSEHGAEARGWFRFARLFRLLMDDGGWNGSFGSGGSGSMDGGGLGEGPGPRTGFGPGSDDGSGDDADLGGRSQRRGGLR